MISNKLVAAGISLVSLGFGLGLATLGVTKWAKENASSTDELVEEMRNLIIYVKDNKITFDRFPYYVSKQIVAKLKTAAFIPLTGADLCNYIRNLSPGNQTILLSGAFELYHLTLAKALANFFGSDLLLLDVYSSKILCKCGTLSRDKTQKRSNTEATSRESKIFGSIVFPSRREGNAGTLHGESSGIKIVSKGTEGSSSSPKLNASTSSVAPIKFTTNWVLDDKLLIKALYKVLSTASKDSPLILFLADVEKLFSISERIHVLFQKMLKNLKGPVLILGSRVVRTLNNKDQINEPLASVFSYKIEVRPPEDETMLLIWKTQLDMDMKRIQCQDLKNQLFEVLAQNDIECDDLGSLTVADIIALRNNIEEIVLSAICYHRMESKNLKYRNGKLLIPARSLSDGLRVFQGTIQIEAKAGDTKEDEASTTKYGEQGPGERVYENLIRSEVIPANMIDVTFDDIGALDDVKEFLQEVVILPIRRPELFQGEILKPCKGLLLFGPPGTGKSMLAEAVAKEAGASFINIAPSKMTSKLFRENEKMVQALFSLAAKVSPTIIFIDEVDIMLSECSRIDSVSSRKFKNEFMLHWDRLRTDTDEQILVLGATNRPFDLDKATIRRFQRRIMVGLPEAERRESIFRTSIENQEGVNTEINFKELAAMTEGYTASDLKNLCIAAAFRPVKELVQKERLLMEVRKSKGKSSEICNKDNATTSREVLEEDTDIDIRQLTMEDFKEAKKQVRPSFLSDRVEVEELKRWNVKYGEGVEDSKAEMLTYFL